MKKSVITTMMVAGLFSLANAQVGIGMPDNTIPNVTLQIDGKPTVATEKDGVLIPRITVTQLAAKTDATYAANQDGALIFVYDVSGATGTGRTAKVTAKGFYYYDNVQSLWLPMTPPVAEVTTNVRKITAAGDYTLAVTDDIVLVMTTAATGGLVNLKLPYTGFSIGKQVHISVIGYKDAAPLVQLVNSDDTTISGVRDYESSPVIYSGMTKTIMFTGDDATTNPNQATEKGTTLSPWVVLSAY